MTATAVVAEELHGSCTTAEKDDSEQDRLDSTRVRSGAIAWLVNSQTHLGNAAQCTQLIQVMIDGPELLHKNYIGRGTSTMATFDSPILHCTVCREVVLRDTTWQQCAEAHGCTLADCPYKDYFTRKQSEEQDSPAPSRNRDEP